MWEIAKLVVVGAVSLHLLTVLRGINDRSLQFVMVALWLRFALSAFHPITYPPLVAGFSINALASIGIAGLGVLLVPQRYYLLKPLLTFYAFFAVILLSGIINREWVGLINVMVKWVYFLAIMLLIYAAMSRHGRGYVLGNIAKVFWLPLGLQLLSVLLGYAKQSEADGSASYIGGYNHEAAFAMMLVAFIYLIVLTPRAEIRFKTTWIMVGLMGLLLANYRTCILAVLPAMLVYFADAATYRLAARDKIAGMAAMLMAMLVLALVLGDTVVERFSDIFAGFAKGSELFVAPQYYTEFDKKLFSARAYIWSMYITAYSSFDLLHQIAGKGPEAWTSVFEKYAHNTFISYLYEYGILGVITISLVFASLLLSCSHGGLGTNNLLLSGGVLGYLIMSNSTMPFWNIEGLIAFAVLVATVLDVRRENYLRSSM